MILFTSDLHLDASRPEITDTFLQLLEHIAPHADALYILGDLFEVWIGDDERSSLAQHVSTALKQLSRKTSVYFMPGNRDFLIGDQFLTQSGCQRLPDPTVIDVYGEPTLLTHGDALCIADKKHQRFRVWSRTAWVRRLFLGLPLSWRRSLAANIREKSQRSQANLDSSILDIVDTALFNWLQQYQVKQVIYGHTHRPSIRWVWQGKQWIQCTVLSDWQEQGNVLACYPGGQHRITTVKHMLSLITEEINHENVAKIS